MEAVAAVVLAAMAAMGRRVLEAMAARAQIHLLRDRRLATQEAAAGETARQAALQLMAAERVEQAGQGRRVPPTGAAGAAARRGRLEHREVLAAPAS
jgi:hypothetical protein